MLEKEKLDGYFIAVDGPNGVGKSTLIEAIKINWKYWDMLYI